MEESILKTLIYADIFDYPVKINEIQKWLIGKKANIRQIESAIKRLNQKSKIDCLQDYYFLPKKEILVRKRLQSKIQSRKYFKKAQILAQILRLVPWIKLVGISGGLAMDNTQQKDDIDLILITRKNRLWISRLCALGILTLTGQRRKKGELKQIAGKLCLNILLEEDKLEQKNQDIFVAHEVLQMKVLWQRNGIYRKYLEDNEWVFRFLPNWIESVESKNSHNTKYKIHNTILDRFENLAKWFQLKIMQKPKGMERIEDGALYFHPADCRQNVLFEYARRIKKLAPLDK